MNQVKKLAGQTAIYGVSSILGRFLNYLLVPLHTRVLVTGQYGTINELYAYIAFLLVILTYGMETAFFRYNEKMKDNSAVFSTSVISIFVTTCIFIITAISFSHDIADLLRYPNHHEYIIYFVLIVSFDALASIPFAKLRSQRRPMRFAMVKLINIGVNIGLNLVFYVDFSSFTLKTDMGVSYVFIANLIASGVTLLLLSPQFLKIKLVFDTALWRRMIVYALPLLLFGLAGIVNEMLDRILIKYLLPEDTAMSQLGIYGACYKVSILMTIFIQAFRYAAEPFFFAQEQEKRSKETYAQVLKYFFIIGLFIFLGIMLFIDVVMLFVDKPYREGQPVIPILLMANLFLGVYYNLSIWYKLTDKTKFGAYISIFGAIVTLILNFYWIPRIGYMGSAWATLVCYVSMTIVSYFIGRKHFPVKYDFGKMAFYLVVALFFYFGMKYVDITSLGLKYTLNIAIIAVFALIVYIFERKGLKKKHL